MRRISAAALIAAGVLAALLAVACGRESDSSSEREITVFAASSLTESFKDMGAAFEEANLGVNVTFNFAASSALATQINEGAPADVFAAADAAQMKAVTDAGHAGEAVTFARNTPVVVVPAGSAAVGSFADLAKPGLKLVLAAAEVPIGRYSREILAKASGPGGVSPEFSGRVLANLKSNEANVRAVLAKVQLGEADAGIVYRTDAAAAGNDVKVVEIPLEFNVVAEYPIATVTQTKNQAAADAFVAFVRSAAGAAILQKHGFANP